ncbi:hypothetical protein DMENIID0001_152270 [Sergentomyia squamirostris]
MGNSSSSSLHHKGRKCHSLPTSPDVRRQLPLSYAKAGPNGGTAIPLPATVLVTRRCPPDKVRPLPPTPGQQTTTLTKQSGAISGDGSSQQSTASNSPLSKGNNSVRHSQPMGKAPPSPYSSHNSIPNGSIGGGVENSAHKQSMLHKFKLFNREKSDRTKQQTSKRTSSSSGFSSARSERSDSSLSLNDGQSNKVVTSGGKKGDQKTQKVGSTKQTTVGKMGNCNSTAAKMKLDKGLSGSGRKETDTQIPTAPKVQNKSTVAKAESVSSVGKSSSKSNTGPRMEVRSESRNSLSSVSKASVVVAANTGIPKPMAAIKGTSKPPATIDRSKTEDTEVQNKLDISPSPINIMKHHQTNQYISGQTEADHKTQIVNPLEGEKSSHQTNQHLSGVSIAMTDSTHSSSTHSTSTGLHSNSSESSVIYRPSSESGSDIYHSRASYLQSPLRSVIPNRKLDRLPPHPAYRGASEPFRGDQQKFHTVPSKQSLGEEEKPVAVVPMRPLLRGYNSHVTLPTRGTRGHRTFIVPGGFCADDLTTQGYCSDTDGLKPLSNKYGEIDNGYLSEGGSPGKHLMSVIRQRQMLPTTIEER